MAAPKGFLPPAAGMGRPKGCKNKVPSNLVEKIIKIEADLSLKGKGLAACALSDPKWFLEHFVKPVIPKNVDLNVAGNLKTTVEVIFAGNTARQDNG
jgi:hypothetical protein